MKVVNNSGNITIESETKDEAKALAWLTQIIMRDENRKTFISSDIQFEPDFFVKINLVEN